MFHLCSIALMSISLFVSKSEEVTNLPFLSLVLGNLAAWSHGSCIVYPSPVFDPKAIVDAVIGQRCTALHGVPTHFLGVLGEVEKRELAGEKLDFQGLRWDGAMYVLENV